MDALHAASSDGDVASCALPRGEPALLLEAASRVGVVRDEVGRPPLAPWCAEHEFVVVVSVAVLVGQPPRL